MPYTKHFFRKKKISKGAKNSSYTKKYHEAFFENLYKFKYTRKYHGFNLFPTNVLSPFSSSRSRMASW
jgi:hypothetical protein